MPRTTEVKNKLEQKAPEKDEKTYEAVRAYLNSRKIETKNRITRMRSEPEINHEKNLKTDHNIN